MKLEPQTNRIPQATINHDTRFLIQETATGRYLRKDGFWTGDRERATAFCSDKTALAQVEQLKLPLVHLVLSQGNEAGEVGAGLKDGARCRD